jgi:hypothetical protein
VGRWGGFVGGIYAGTGLASLVDKRNLSFECENNEMFFEKNALDCDLSFLDWESNALDLEISLVDCYFDALDLKSKIIE